MNFPIFDLHCDTAYALLNSEDRMLDKRLENNKLHIDLDRASALNGYCQCFACFTTPLETLPPKMSVIDLQKFEYKCSFSINVKVRDTANNKIQRKKFHLLNLLLEEPLPLKNFLNPLLADLKKFLISEPRLKV